MSASLSELYPSKFWLQNVDKNADKNTDEYVVKPSGEKWRRMTVSSSNIVWVSENGKCIFEEKMLTPSASKGAYCIKQTYFTPAKITALAFKVDGWDTIDQQNVVVTLRDPTLSVSLENIWITTKAEISKRNTVARETKGYFEAPLRNNSRGVQFREGYVLYEDGIVMSLLKSSQREPTIIKRINGQGRNVYRARREDTGMYVDILVLIHYGELKDLSYNEVLENYIIKHNNGNLEDDSITNLSYQPKNPSIEKQRKERVMKRLSDLHRKIVALLQKRKAVLISPLDAITTVGTPFKYKCLCGEKESSYSNIAESENCGDCLHNKLKEVTSDNLSIYTDFNDGSDCYVRFERGWITKEAKVLNNLKQPAAINKGYVTLGGFIYSVKEIMAKLFRIPNYEKVDNKKYYVFQIESGNDYSLSNLVVRSFSDDTIIRKNVHKTSIDEQVLNGVSTDDISTISIVSVNEVKGVESKTHPEFPKCEFYANGIYRSSIGNYVRGNIDKQGYRTTIIRKKNYKVHRLICFVFNPIEGKTNLSDYDDLEVDHKNANKLDNHFTNLRWVTPSENRKAGVELNLYKANKAVYVYKATDEGKKGEKLNQFNTMTDTTKACNICHKTLRRLTKTEEVYKGLIYSFN